MSAAELQHADLMDHRDVIDAARKRVDEGGHVKMRLPVGAFLGGLYHLGNGVFVGKLPSPADSLSRPPRMKEPPELVGLYGKQSVLDAQPQAIALVLCDNPLPQSLAAAEYRRVLPTHLVVPMVDAVIGKKVLRSVQTGKVVHRGIR